MSENMEDLLRWNGELQTPITYWAYNPYQSSSVYDYVMNSIRTSRDKNSPPAPKPEPDQPKTDRDFIRFGPRV